MKKLKMNIEKQLHNLIKNECKTLKGTPVALSGGLDSSLLTAIIKPKFVISVQLPNDPRFNEIDSAKRVVKYLNLKQVVVRPDVGKFDEYVTKAVKAIKRPIPHFNIFPLFCMYKRLNEMGVKEIVLGDGPDESMCGYARNLIMKYLYWDSWDIKAFSGYQPLFERLLPTPEKAYSLLTGKSEKTIAKLFKDATREGSAMFGGMCKVDMKLMRPDMDDMSNRIAKHFRIKNIRPYQDSPLVDDFMYSLPLEAKIKDYYGKYLLRKVAERYLPKDIVWCKRKVGGPVWPVNITKGWVKTDGEFGKSRWLAYQKEILK